MSCRRIYRRRRLHHANLVEHDCVGAIRWDTLALELKDMLPVTRTVPYEVIRFGITPTHKSPETSASPPDAQPQTFASRPRFSRARAQAPDQALWVDNIHPGPKG